MKVNVKKINPRAVMPVYSSSGAAGADLFSAEEKNVDILPGGTALISTGLSVDIPEGYAGFIFARSGLSVKEGLAPANKVGVIDSDYRGEVKVALYNQSKDRRTVVPGERIAQMVILAVTKAEFAEGDLSETERGDGGFGSTGK